MAQAATQLSVMVFPGTQTLPVFAAQALGFFARRGLAVELKPAPNSEEQRQGLAAGRYQIVHGAADQCVALVEAAKVDAAIVAGGDNGFNHLFVQRDIASIADLRGRTLVADVANTGWSFVLYEILRRHGLKPGDYRVHEAGAPFRRFEAMRQDRTMAAAILNPPFAIHARRAGLKDMGAAVDAIGPYLGTVPYVLRAWAERHADVLVAYLAACIEGLRWSLDPANKAARRNSMPTGSMCRPISQRRCRRSRPIPSSDWPRMPRSIWKASRPCCACAPRSRAWNRRRPRNISIFPITGARWPVSDASAALALEIVGHRQRRPHQAGGRSSSVTSATGLNTLKWCRRSSDQNAITVSIGGQPGTAQATCATRIAASPSEKRRRTHSLTRSSAAVCSGLFLVNASILRPSCPATRVRPFGRPKCKLVPGIHVLLQDTMKVGMDGRNKSGHATERVEIND